MARQCDPRRGGGHQETDYGRSCADPGTDDERNRDIQWCLIERGGRQGTELPVDVLQHELYSTAEDQKGVTTLMIFSWSVPASEVRTGMRPVFVGFRKYVS